MRSLDRGSFDVTVLRSVGRLAVGFVFAIACAEGWASGPTQPATQPARRAITPPPPVPPPTGSYVPMQPGAARPVSGMPAPAMLQPPTTRPTTSPAAPGTSPKLRCPEPAYAFAEAWGGENVEHTWIIYNDGTAPLEILSVSPGCSCTVAEYDKMISPGGQGKITARLTTRNLHGDVTKNITVKTNDPAAAQFSLQLKGKIKRRVEVDPPGGAQFAQGRQDADITKTVKVTNNTSAPMKLEALPVPPLAAFGCTVKEIEAGKSYEVTVTAYKDKIKEGSNVVSFGFKTGIPEEANIYVQANLYAPPIVQVSPTSVAIATPATAAVHREVTVSYNGVGAMRITEVTSSDPAVKVRAQVNPMAPGAGVGAAGAAAQPATQPAQTAGRSWKVTIDAPAGWAPGDANATEGQASPVPAKPIEITIQTDVKDKPLVTVPITIHPQAVIASSLIGKSAPMVTVKDNAGKNVTLGAATGHVTVTAFFASWCPHCKRMLPILQRLSGTYSNKGVDFNLISLDSVTQANAVDKVLKDLGVAMPYILDPQQVAGKKYGANKFPMVFMIGKNNILEGINDGCPANFEETVKAQLDMLLAGKDRMTFPKPQQQPQQQPTTPPGPVVTRTLSSQPAPGVTGPSLVLDSVQQDMGPCKPGATGKYSLYLRNNGTSALHLTNITTTPGLTVEADSPKEVLPNAPAALRLQYTAPKQPGPVRHQITIESDDAAKPKVTVALNATVMKFIEAIPANGVDFGRRPSTWTNDRMANLVWNGEGPLKILGIESSSPKFEGHLKPDQEGPNYIMFIKAKPPFEVGETVATLTITTDCKEQPTVVMPVKLVQPKRVEVSPLSLSVTKAGRQLDNTVSIMNYGDTSINVLSVKASNNKIRTQFYPDLDGVSYKMRVTVAQGFAPGPEGETVTIRTDDKEFGEIVIPIKVAEDSQPIAPQPLQPQQAQRQID